MRALFLLLPLLLFAANVNVTVNKKTITSGEELIVTITAEGKDIKFPNIQEIDGNTVVGISNSSSISIINGNVKEIVSKSFIIYPQRDLTIPSFTVIIDGKKYKTKPIHIKVIEPKQTKGNFELDINVSKHTLYLGESAILTLTFTKKANAASIQIQKPTIKNFIIKPIKSIQKENKVIYKFLIIPQKSGTYEVGPFIAQVGKLVKTNVDDFLGLQIASIKYHNIYSNKLKINVKPIPNGAIFGDFNISINAKKEVNANEPTKVNLLIKGCGDFYSINQINLNIPDVTIYTSKPKLDLTIKNNKLCGTFKEDFTIIADKNYTIPSIKLKTFDGKLHIISTKPFKVTVKEFNLKPKPKINKAPTIPTTNKHTNLAYIILISLISLIIGIILGILFIKIYNKIKNNEFTKIINANEKELLNILKKYEFNEEIKEIMQKIEENIYKNANNKIDKKTIINTIKNIKDKK